MSAYSSAGGYGESGPGENWPRPTEPQFDVAYSDMGSEQLNFQSFNEGDQYYGSSATPGNISADPNASQVSFLDPPPTYYGESVYTPMSTNRRPTQNQGNTMTPASFEPEMFEEDEPPLLEELGIDPERIMEKTLAALNPFRRLGPTDDVHFLLRDSDLAGPLVFCIALGACLMLGGKIHFGYIYGLAVTCCLMMYILLTLMTHTTPSVTLLSVASVLGYCILPIVGLSVLGIFISLRGPIGMSLTLLAVGWCSLSSSRLFVTMLQETEQRPLIAYPCALLYGSFALIAIF